jgi:ferric-dicitrate binding protein FerR (iron transport regulator)
MDINSYTTEDLVCDESFRNYCMGSDPAAIQIWTSWIKDHPEKSELVREAQLLISILNARQGNVQDQLEELKDGMFRLDLLKASLAGGRKRRWIYPAGIAASILVLVLAAYLFIFRKNPARLPMREEAGLIASIRSGGEPRKTVVLPDGSVVTLHSNSTLMLSEGFGHSGRELTLSGEALFDIVHNEQLPFIVHTAAVNVEVLGTLFNLNAYPQNSYTETALFRGKVAVSLKGHPEQKLILSPSQKSVVYNDSGKMDKGIVDSLLKKVSLSVDPVNHKAKEIAWVRNRIRIEDEPLEMIASRLQAWYGIPIVFTDNETKGYRYSGTFESETVVKALEALQLSYPFNFRVEKDTIVIGK